MKRVVPYPLLLIIAIVLDRVAISSFQIGIEQSLRTLFVLILLTTVTAYTIQYFIRDWQYTDFIVLMMPVTLLAYRSLYGFLKVRFPHQANYLGLALIVLLGLLYAVAVSRRAWQSIRNPAQVTAYFYLVFTVLLSFQVVRLVKESYNVLMNLDSSQATTISKPALDLHVQNESYPDIYVIILDGYGRQDVLQTIYNHDNSEFIGWLEQRGFYVASDNHSNYTQTAYVMASLWNFDYLEPWDSSDEYTQYLFEPIHSNRVFHSLDALGYTTVSSEGALSYIEMKQADVYLSDFLPLNHFETLLLMDSPLEPLSNIFDLGMPLHTYKTHRQRTLDQIDRLKEIPASIAGPKIVYTHILAPHPPFLFYQNGDAREPQRPYTLAEGIELQGGEEEYWNGYREQVRFLNTEIMDSIDSILAKSETPPIILLMGDHGPASMFNWDLNDPGCLWERTSNLYAILLPGHQNDGTVYPSISPVNTFRVIFNTYFGTDLPLLEDRSYMASWQQPTLMVDVTGKRDSIQGCTMPNLSHLDH